jgi:hypothetical protein
VFCYLRKRPIPLVNDWLKQAGVTVLVNETQGDMDKESSRKVFHLFKWNSGEEHCLFLPPDVVNFKFPGVWQLFGNHSLGYVR